MGNTCSSSSISPKQRSLTPSLPVTQAPKPPLCQLSAPNKTKFRIPNKILNKFNTLYFPSGTSIALSQEVGSQFQKFFALASNSHQKSFTQNYEAITRQQLVPSPLVDRLWRLLICDQSQYQNQCKTVLGFFWQRSSKLMFSLQNYKRTLLLYRQHFGKPPRRIWPYFSDAEQMQISREGFMLIKSSVFAQFSQNLEQKSLALSLKEFSQQCVKEVSALKEKTRIRPSTMDAIIQMLLAPPELKRPQTALTETSIAQESLYQQAQEDWIQGKNCRGRSGSFTMRSRRFLDSVTLDDVISEEVSTMEQLSSRSHLQFQKKLKPESRQVQESSALDISVDSDFLQCPEQDESILLHQYHSCSSQASSQDQQEEEDICVAVGTIDDDIFNSSSDCLAFNQYFPSTKGTDITRFQKILKTLPLPKLTVKNFKREVNVSSEFAELVVEEYKRFLILT